MQKVHIAHTLGFLFLFINRVRSSYCFLNAHVKLKESEKKKRGIRIYPVFYFLLQLIVILIHVLVSLCNLLDQSLFLIPCSLQLGRILVRGDLEGEAHGLVIIMKGNEVVLASWYQT